MSAREMVSRERKDLAPVEGLFCRSLQNSVFACFVAFEPKDVNSAVVQRNVIHAGRNPRPKLPASRSQFYPDGMTNSTVTNNTVTAMTNTPPLICASWIEELW